MDMDNIKRMIEEAFKQAQKKDNADERAERQSGAILRSLKFRAWDKDRYRFEYFEIGENDDCYGIFRATANKFGSAIEQYTGLKDKNGKEIYEGDILMDDCSEPFEYWTVKHEYGKFVGETQGVVEDVYELTDLEVIGDIHENPELLKNLDNRSLG